MALRAPPGRAGRLWLVRRLEIARRGVEVLDQKRQTLLREQQRLSEALAGSTRAWEQKARAAAEWNDRALAIAGERRLRLAAGHVAGRCEVEVEWRNALGTVFPAGASVRPGLAPDFVALDFVALGGGSAVALAAPAHADAVVAAADYAAARAAHDAIAAELTATTRRQRAIERRWIPEHEAALRRLELALDDREREDIARVHWAMRHRTRAADGVA
jgi:V/A-type H+-transporting ATPase subunit D